MVFVCLSNLNGATDPTDPTELAVAALEVVPRARLERASTEPLLWADARSLDAPRVVRRLFAVVGRYGSTSPRAGVATSPVAARVASIHGRRAITVVPVGTDREFLAGHPIGVLGPSDGLQRLLRGAGVERCGDLARLQQASVEVAFGPEAVELWRLARADDRCVVFAPMPRELPHASLDWTEYVLRDPEQLLFIVNRLATTVCAALHAGGEGARAFALVFALANGAKCEQPFRPARANADPRAWLRLVRAELERIVLPDAVTGVLLRVDVVAPSETVQGDVLDRGFATAKEAEDAIARILDQGSSVVTPENSRHPLVTRRTRWIQEPPALVWARPQIGDEDTEPALALYLYSEPELVEVETVDRRGFAAPLRYAARDGRHDLVTASGPDCVSGGQWEEAYAYELYCCVRGDGEIILLARDARNDAWQLAGTWR